MKVIHRNEFKHKILILDVEDFDEVNTLKIRGMRFDMVFVPETMKDHKNFTHVINLIMPSIAIMGELFGDIYFYNRLEYGQDDNN